MTIYTSDKAMPYVYMCINKYTGAFYIGYRAKNAKLGKPSHIDFPEYKTSSKKVKSSFSEYDWIILAEFFDSASAYDVEQALIHDHWGNPLLLNNSCHYGKKRFKNSAHTEETKQKISTAQKGRPGRVQTEEIRQKIANTLKGRSVPEERKKRISDAKLGKPRAPMSDETKRKISETKKLKALEKSLVK
jgi:hypothetical protein